MVVNPISSDPISPQSSSIQAEQGSAARGRDTQAAQPQNEPEAIERTPGDDSLQLSSTSQVLEAAANRPAAGPSIESPAQASDVLAQLTASFRDSGAAALQAQTGSLQSEQATALL